MDSVGCPLSIFFCTCSLVFCPTYSGLVVPEDGGWQLVTMVCRGALDWVTARVDACCSTLADVSSLALRVAGFSDRLSREL
ncbi:uncharacterized protein LY79DRAFT_554171 [Colletotrichum navitas]|uniref:Uncharacterized protein n=1 Tax=Colletotrichum navitas TaxID=681940 RepID=A0AAD8PYQ4_9PEZI|nr:uncharacterized protein LY79DRAFT_554171 [Colletotrichum navitas]KAK1590549.1 hypothetical protein LY79DRAFT_554171 [Colletotrichum navitas]